MIDSIKSAWDGFLEKLSSSFQEQQEREWFIRLKERYESLPPTSQLLVKFLGAMVMIMALLWVPVTDLMDASDLNTNFSERREALKDLLKIEREYASVPFVPSPAPPAAMRAIFDQKIGLIGIKPEQIKEVQESMERGTANAERRGVSLTFTHVTVKQALDLAYELEQADKSLRLTDFQLDAEQADPHFYQLRIKLINFSPKMGRG